MKTGGALAACAVLAVGAAIAAEGPAPQASARLGAASGKLGDPVDLVLEVAPPPDCALVDQTIGPVLGPFRVLEGSWRPREEGGAAATWRGKVAAYRLGELELPPIRLACPGGSERGEIVTRAVPFRVTGRFAADDPAAAKLAEIRGPARIVPDWGPLRIALGIVAGLLAIAAAGWWAHRRYAAALRAVPPPDDPFRRLPPDEWAYEELRSLLDRRLAEAGEIDAFFSALSRVVKTYLAGRYRIDLEDATTDEVPPRLAAAGPPPRAIAAVRALLDRCDRVKFAGERPAADACRSAVEAAYGIVDATRPERARVEEAGAA